MNHDDLITRLRADLDAYVGEPGLAPALDEAAAFTPVRGPQRRWPLAAAAAATVAIVVAGLAVIARRGDPDVADVPTAPPATSVAPSDAPRLMPVPPTPDGWQVVEWGDVRLSLPPDIEPYGPGCTSAARDESTVIITCGDRELTILSGTAGGGVDPDRPGVQRNGLLTDLVPVPDLDDATQLLVDDTSSLVRFVGFAPDEIGAIADTVGVSSTWRVRLEPAPPVPDGWQTVEVDGFSFRVPGDWTVSELAPPELDFDVCGFVGVTSGVVIGRGSLDASAINCPAGRALVPPTDGVRVYPDDTGGGPRSLGNPYFSRILGSVTPPYVILVGLGGDGTIGRTILGSVIEDARDPAPGSTAPETPVTTAPTAPTDDAVYETAGTVIDTAETGPMLCLSTLDSLPPQCGGGIPLAGWSWDDVEGEQEQGGTVWSESPALFIRGRFNPATGPAMTVLEVRPLTDADRERWSAAGAPREPDFSVPCPEPAGGWPTAASGSSAWPGEAVEQLDGYAGSWIDRSQRVYTVKIVGDVVAAEAAIRRLYDGAVCVVEGRFTVPELLEIQDTLMALSSVQVLSSSVMYDASGEWVEATVIVPDPALQDRLDAEYGAGVVRLTSQLVAAG